MNDTSVLYKPFNIETHSKEFINYLEVIIKPNGEICYAIPSRQQALEKIAREKHKDFDSMINKLNFSVDYLTWLCDLTCCISVWNEFCVKPKITTNMQSESLKKLKEARYVMMPHLTLYQGEL